MIHNVNTRVGPFLHVRFRGLSRDVELATLQLNAHSPDAEVRRALARHLDVAEADLANHVIERHASGNVTLRPEAVFG